MAITPVPPLTPTPPFPALSDRADGTYNSKAFEFGTHMASKFNGELAAVATSVFNNAAEAQARATDAGAAAAASAADRAQTAADRIQTGEDVIAAGQEVARATAEVARAAAEADRAEAAAGQIGTSAAFSDANPIVKGSANETKLAGIDVDSNVPAGTRVDIKWPSSPGTMARMEDLAKMTRHARTSNQILVAANSNNFIDITEGTFTQTFSSPAVLGSGWFCYIRNSGSGNITIPASDDRTNWILYSGECRLFHSDGSSIRSVILKGFSKVFETSGVFVKPPGYTFFHGELWASGGSGSKSDSANSTGGTGGGYLAFSLAADKFSLSENVIIAAGGAAVTVNGTGTNGVPGGSSSVGSLLTVAPGMNVLEGPATSRIFGGGDVTTKSSLYGGGYGGFLTAGGDSVSPPGTSVLAGRGGVARRDADGEDGLVPAGGGGATKYGSKSGAGGRGELRIWGTA